MKPAFKFAMGALALLFAGNTAYSQTKIGYVNMAELIQAMPDAARADSQLTAYINEQREPLQALQNEFEKKLEAFQQLGEDASEAVLADKEQELQSLQERYQQFQNRLQQDAQKKQRELLAPIHERIMQTINEIANQNEYTYVIDNSSNILLKAPEGDNLLPAVKEKLGV